MTVGVNSGVVRGSDVHPWVSGSSNNGRPSAAPCSTSVTDIKDVGGALMPRDVLSQICKRTR